MLAHCDVGFMYSDDNAYNTLHTDQRTRRRIRFFCWTVSADTRTDCLSQTKKSVLPYDLLPECHYLSELLCCDYIVGVVPSLVNVSPILGGGGGAIHFAWLLFCITLTFQKDTICTLVYLWFQISTELWAYFSLCSYGHVLYGTASGVDPHDPNFQIYIRRRMNWTKS